MESAGVGCLLTWSSFASIRPGSDTNWPTTSSPSPTLSPKPGTFRVLAKKPQSSAADCRPELNVNGGDSSGPKIIGSEAIELGRSESGCSGIEIGLSIMAELLRVWDCSDSVSSAIEAGLSERAALLRGLGDFERTGFGPSRLHERVMSNVLLGRETWLGL